MNAQAVAERGAHGASRQGEAAGRRAGSASACDGLGGPSGGAHAADAGSREAGGAACAALPFPAGRRAPRGALRWYPVRVPEGREAAEAARAAKLLSPAAAESAFPAWREKWVKRAGAWQVRVEPLFRGYFLAASRDAAALRGELSRLGLGAGALAPLPDEARAWYAAAMDGRRVVRASEGVIEGGELRVTSGPLVGREASVRKIDRHKRCCEVRLQAGRQSFTERLALNVPTKS